MTTKHSRLIHMTDDAGQSILPEEDRFEPEPGSIVLVCGLTGTAWQRQFSDGLWHRCGGGKAKGWVQLIQNRGVILVYDAEERA